jgi:hypothetical protein
MAQLAEALRYKAEWSRVRLAMALLNKDIQYLLMANLSRCQVNVGTYLLQSSRYVPTFQGNLLFLKRR